MAILGKSSDNFSFKQRLLGAINAVTSFATKSTLVGADSIIISDSEDGGALKEVALSSLVSNVTPIQEDDALNSVESNYAFEDIDNVNIGRFTAVSANVILRGIVPPNPVYPKLIIIQWADSVKDLRFQHNDPQSVAENRFLCPKNLQFVLNKNSGASIQYDTTSLRWRIIAQV